MKQFLQLLMIAQLAAIGVAASVAVLEIESILVSGPLLSLVGLTIAAICFQRRLLTGLLFGCSVPTISVICFAIINVMAWGPNAAQTPISMLLVAFALGSLPWGFYALRETDRAAEIFGHGPLQFRLSALLGLMAAVSLPLALHRLGLAAFSLGVLAAYGLLLGYTLHRFYAGRPCAGEAPYGPKASLLEEKAAGA